MNNDTDHRSSSLRLISWIARGISTASLFFLLFFAIGEGFNPQQISSKELFLILFFPLGFAAGMVIGWWKENIGAVTIFISLILFYVVHFFYRGIFPHGWTFLIISSPGFLFIPCWYRSRYGRRIPVKSPLTLPRSA